MVEPQRQAEGHRCNGKPQETVEPLRQAEGRRSEGKACRRLEPQIHTDGHRSNGKPQETVEPQRQVEGKASRRLEPLINTDGHRCNGKPQETVEPQTQAEGQGYGEKRSGQAELPGPAWRQRAQAFIDYAGEQLRHPSGGARARAYLFAERGLKAETWDLFCLGYNPATVYDDPRRWGLETGSKIWLPRGIVIPGMSGIQPAYIKIRRPRAGEALSEYLEPEAASRPGPKFGGPRGGRQTLFGSSLWLGHCAALLVEGEWDAMLAYQQACDLCDTATPGGAGRQLEPLELGALSRFGVALAVSDDDAAGERARETLSRTGRMHILRPPAHDLSDYWRGGGNLRGWIAAAVAEHLGAFLKGLDRAGYAAIPEEWELEQRAAAEASGFPKS